MTDEFRIEKESPISDLRPGKSFDDRAAVWLAAAHEMFSHRVAWARDIHGPNEEVSLLLTNRQADHLSMGLNILASHFGRGAAV